MALGNIECPNCGSTFEYDPNNRIAKCPSCGTQFMVRDVEMKTTVNNYYTNSNANNTSAPKKDTTENDYKSLCTKLIAYAEHAEEKKMNKILNVISNEYPNSYFNEINRLFTKHGYYYAFFSPDEYIETKKKHCDNLKALDHYYCVLMMRSLRDEGYKMTKEQLLILYQPDKENNPDLNNEVETNVDAARLFFQHFVEFTDELESSSYIKKYLKHDFEKEHYDALKKLRGDAEQMLAKLEKLDEDIKAYINKNKMSCVPYLEELENCQVETEDTTYYTYGLRESKVKTGIVCDIIAYMLLAAAIIATIIAVINSIYFPLIGYLYLGAYVCMFIGTMRYNDGSGKNNWFFFVFLPPVAIVFFIIFSISTFVLVGRSKSSKKKADEKYNKIVDRISGYKTNAKYKTLEAFVSASGIKFIA